MALTQGLGQILHDDTGDEFGNVFLLGRAGTGNAARAADFRQSLLWQRIQRGGHGQGLPIA